MPHAFSRRLREGPLLCDGATGTALYARGVSLDGCFDALNLNLMRPFGRFEVVTEVLDALR